MSRSLSSGIPTSGKSGGPRLTLQTNTNQPGYSNYGKPPSGKLGKPTSPTELVGSPRTLQYAKSTSPSECMRSKTLQYNSPTSPVSMSHGSPTSPSSQSSMSHSTSDRFSYKVSSRPSAATSAMPIAGTSGSGAVSPPTDNTGQLTRPASLTSVTSLSTPVDQVFGPAGDRRKVTLGEILREIEEKMNRLLSKENFLTSDCEEDLSFLATQTRYSADQQIKRRIICKIVDMNVAFLFIKVFRSAHKVDYLTLPEEAGDNISVGSHSIANGTSAGPTTSSATGKDHRDEILSLRDDISIASSSASKFTDKKRTKATPGMASLKVATKIMWNTTDKSPALCEECIRQGIIQMLLTDLSGARLGVAEMKDHHRLYIVRGFLGILHNVNRYCSGEARDICRENGAVKILQQYLKSTWLTLKTTTIMVLSYIINESENDIINATDKHLVYIIKILEAAVRSENHFAKRYGFWAVEISAGLNRLASNDANKSRIVQKGALPLYTELLQRSCTEEEQLVAAQGIWIMAFDAQSKQLIRDQAGCMEALRILERCSTREEIRKAARGALWIIEDKGNTSRTLKSPSVRNHIMITYQWSARPLLLNIQDRLKNAGYRVWMDVDCMSGSTLEAMADAIENAAVVLICMSQKYKDSPSCRTEAEYAYQRRKDIVPVRVQHRYNADGWLGALLGTKLYFDFTRSDSFDMMMSNLIRELGCRGRSSTLEYRDTQQHALPTSAVVKPHIARWKTEDVHKFLSDNGLSDVAAKWKEVDGELLMEVKKMLRSAPESFYTTMKSDLKLNFVTVLRLTKALDKLEG